jgi:hypothetical protein
MSNSTSNLSILPYGKAPRTVVLPVGASTHIYAGTMVAQLSETGGVVALSTANSGQCIGIADHEQDNSAGAVGNLRVRVLSDFITLQTNDATNPFADTSLLGSLAYAVDDHTVGTSHVSSTLKVAGIFMGLEPDSGGKVRVFHTATPLSAPFGINSLQLVTGTLVSGLCTVTVGVGQKVTATTRAIPFMQAVVTGSANVGTLTHMVASNVAGGNGVGQVLFQMLGSDGATDVDAAGAFAALLIN